MKTLKKILFLGLIVLMAAGTAFARGNTQEGKVKIEFFSLKREAFDIMEKLIADFEKENPNIDVEQTLVPDPERVLVTRMSGGDTPEVFSSWYNASFPQRVSAGYIADLSSLAALNQIKPNALRDVRINGKDYLLPISYNTMGIWYNKDIFAKYNLQVPTTWADFVRVCETLKAAGVTPALICGKELEPARQDMNVYLLSMPDYQTLHSDIIGRKVDLSKPYGQSLRDMAGRILQYLSYAQADVLGSGRDQLRNDFAAGRSAMYIEGSWAIPTFLSANPNLNFSMMPWPAVNATDTRVTAFVGDFALCLSSTAKHPEESKKFLEFLTRPSSGNYYAEKDGSISCIKGIDYVAPQLKEQTEVIDSGRSVPPPDIFWTTKQQDDIGAALQQLYMNQNIDAFVRELQNIWNNG
jgi:raffinose/stachyose/melibiose transport system substrate-binding protein